MKKYKFKYKTKITTKKPAEEIVKALEVGNFDYNLTFTTKTIFWKFIYLPHRCTAAHLYK